MRVNPRRKLDSKTLYAETNTKKNKEKDTESPLDLLKGKIRKTEERTCRESQCSFRKHAKINAIQRKGKDSCYAQGRC